MSHAAHSAIFPPAAPLDFNRFYASSGLIFSASTGSPSGVAHFLSDPHVDPNHFEGGCNALMRAVLYGDADSVALLAPKTDLMARSELGNRHTDGDKTALRIAARALAKNMVATGRKFRAQTQIVETIAAHMPAEALDAQFRAAALEGSFREAETLSLHARDRAITETFS